MLNSLINFLKSLLGSSNDGFKPSKSDKELMENTQVRLSLALTFGVTPGTVLRSLPGVVVHVDGIDDGTIACRVLDATDSRHIGTITDGKIVYAQPAA